MSKDILKEFPEIVPTVKTDALLLDWAFRAVIEVENLRNTLLKEQSVSNLLALRLNDTHIPGSCTIDSCKICATLMTWQDVRRIAQ